MKTSVIAVATLAIACMSGMAQATTARHMDHAVVSFGDLDLSNEAAKATLLARIDSAARSVCGLRSSGTWPIELASLMKQCAAQAKARALADIDMLSLADRSKVVVRGTLVARR